MIQPRRPKARAGAGPAPPRPTRCRIRRQTRPLPEPRPRPGSVPDTVELRRARLHRLLENALTTPLPLSRAEDAGAPLQLCTLPPSRRRVEMEFHLPAQSLTPEALNAFLDRYGYASPTLGFATLRGFLKGFIDLVFEHQGRYWVLDWKSNWLGMHPSMYGPQAVEAEMRRHGYHLQHLFYTVALHRFLRLRLRDYDPARHLGGAVYLFVRAVRPGLVVEGHPVGAHIHATPVPVVQALSALIDPEGERHG